jgi:hypothetical protein
MWVPTLFDERQKDRFFFVNNHFSSVKSHESSRKSRKSFLKNIKTILLLLQLKIKTEKVEKTQNFCVEALRSFNLEPKGIKSVE